jgi:hypothetical protein
MSSESTSNADARVDGLVRLNIAWCISCMLLPIGTKDRPCLVKKKSMTSVTSKLATLIRSIKRGQNSFHNPASYCETNLIII